MQQDYEIEILLTGLVISYEVVILVRRAPNPAVIFCHAGRSDLLDDRLHIGVDLYMLHGIAMRLC